MPRKGPRTGNLDTQDGFNATFLTIFLIGLIKESERMQNIFKNQLLAPEMGSEIGYYENQKINYGWGQSKFYFPASSRIQID